MAAPVVPEELAGEETTMLYVLALSTVSLNSWLSAVAGMPFIAPPTPEIVTKSPVAAPWLVSFTVTVVEPLTVVNALAATDSTSRIGVMS